MKNYIRSFSFFLLCLSLLTLTINIKAQDTMSTKSSIHQFTVKSIDGNEIDFANFEGKKIMIVNTASECGFTPQYEGLQKLYNEHKKDLVIVGFPSNNFGGQEPGSNEEIQGFCQKNYGVTFPLAAKVSVLGEDAAPLFRWLTDKSKNQVMDAEIKWNFTKFLLDEDGHLIAKFDSSVEPLSEEILEKLKE